MRYWVVSHNVNNDLGTLDDWKKAIVKYQAAFLGYDSDHQKGVRFRDEIEIGDIVLIARGSNPNKELLACGQVASEAKTDLVIPHLEYGMYRNLSPFVELKADPGVYRLDFTKGAYGIAPQIPALYELKPERSEGDKSICNFLNRQIPK
jgi:hypothetical protein